jgi:hypothetical protein
MGLALECARYKNKGGAGIGQVTGVLHKVANILARGVSYASLKRRNAIKNTRSRREHLLWMEAKR